MSRAFTGLLVYLIALLGASAESRIWVISGIEIEGNKVTRENFILRELDLSTGDTLYEDLLESTLELNRNRIFNTGLFNEVKIIPAFEKEEVKLTVLLSEKWYVWPYPVLMFADRNFNVWWETRDPGRLNAGVSVLHTNFRGRGERLKFSSLLGYTHKLNLEYEMPYLDRDQKKGLYFQAGYFSNKELWYKASENRLRFLFDPNTRTIRVIYGEVAWLYRPAWYTRHRFSLGMEEIQVSDTVLSEGINQMYLAGGRDRQSSIRFNYTLKLDYRDIAYYPLKGFFLEVNLEPRYLIEDRSVYGAVRFNFESFYDLKHGFYGGLGLRSKVSTPGNQPYNLYSSLGYKFFVRGFEPYVIDGQHYTLLQTNVKYRLFQRDLKFPFIPVSQFKKAPTSVFLTAYADAAYVHSTQFTDQGNDYANKLLSGYGVGIDMVTFYDRVIRIEYSINSFGLKGLYLHFTAPI